MFAVDLLCCDSYYTDYHYRVMLVLINEASSDYH